jgi:hypothetical protein
VLCLHADLGGLALRRHHGTTRLSGTGLSPAPRFAASGRGATRQASSTLARAGSAVVRRATLATATFGAHARCVNLPARALSGLAAFAVIQKSWIIVQQSVAGGQEGDGAERLQFAMTSIA